MKLRTLLNLQVSYCLLGILFNVVNWSIRLQGFQGLTPTEPLSGIVIMSVYGICLLFGYAKKRSIYRLLMGIFLLIFVYGGIIKHIATLQESPELYFAFWTGVLGVLINLYGFGLNTLAVLGRFVQDKP